MLDHLQFSRTGKTVADRLILQSHLHVSNNPTFPDGAEALLDADKDLYSRNHKTTICQVMSGKGIFTQGCAWEPWGITLSENHPWNVFMSNWTIYSESVNLQPVNGIVSLDTATIPDDGGPGYLGMSGLVNLPASAVSKIVINLTASGLYNQGLVYPCWPFGFQPEYGLINLYDSNDERFAITIMTTPPPPELQGRPYIQATGNYDI